jgi:hypothetical protein
MWQPLYVQRGAGTSRGTRFESTEESGSSKAEAAKSPGQHPAGMIREDKFPEGLKSLN